MSAIILTHEDADGVCAGALALAVYTEARAQWEALDEIKDLVRREGKVAYISDLKFSTRKTATFIGGKVDVLVYIAGEKGRNTLT